MVRGCRAVCLGVGTLTMMLMGARGDAQEPLPDDVVLQRFQGVVRDYVDLHRRLEQSLPPLAVSSDLQQIHEAVEGRFAAIQAARSTATEGDIFDADVSRLFRMRIQNALHDSGHNAADVLADINEEVPADAEWPVVNHHFPWARGAATPPWVISALPPLPEELQYRLVNYDLVLVDLHANFVVDILRGALPAVTGAGETVRYASVDTIRFHVEHDRRSTVMRTTFR